MCDYALCDYAFCGFADRRAGASQPGENGTAGYSTPRARLHQTQRLATAQLEATLKVKPLSLS